MLVDNVVILLVEDEPLIRAALQNALELAGYDVLAASSSPDALSLLEDRNQRPGVLVTDIRLGKGLDGWELARCIRNRDAEVAVVYISGDSADCWPTLGVPNSIMLQKPFSSERLIAEIPPLIVRHEW